MLAACGGPAARVGEGVAAKALVKAAAPKLEAAAVEGGELRAAERAAATRSTYRSASVAVAERERAAASVADVAAAQDGAATAATEVAEVTTTYVTAEASGTVNRCVGGALRGVGHLIVEGQITGESTQDDELFFEATTSCLSSAYPSAGQAIAQLSSLYHQAVADGYNQWSASATTAPTAGEYGSWLAYTADAIDDSGYMLVPT
jgi:hypothetical protein